MKIIQKNIILLVKHAKAASGFLFGIVSVILLFVDKEDLKIDSIGKGILVNHMMVAHGERMKGIAYLSNGKILLRTQKNM